MSRILVVEDRPENRELISTFLQISGHEVLQVEDGQEALRLLETELPDLILLDIQMPSLDGFETLRRVRDNPRVAKLPVIAVTAYAMPGDKEKAMAAGFDGYLTKPIERQLLFAELHRHLRQPR